MPEEEGGKWKEKGRAGRREREPNSENQEALDVLKSWLRDARGALGIKGKLPDEAEGMT